MAFISLVYQRIRSLAFTDSTCHPLGEKAPWHFISVVKKFGLDIKTI